MRKTVMELSWPLLFAALLVVPAFGQCGPWGCPVQQPSPRVTVKGKISAKSPTPAWRYERAAGHRAALVRIYCKDDARTRSIGSGTLVRWHGKLVVLTARHVIKDARRIIVELCTRKTHYAKVLMVDATWDCAVLELTGKPKGVEPAEIEFGPQALQRDGDRLESCGYGPDGKLACNTGLFKGYRRSGQTPNGPDDWMVISGHARGGDSGGGVFNRRGRLVGVLWGTDGETVVCVQAGRVHKILAAAVPYEQKALFDRSPTPPLAGPLAPVPPMQAAKQQGGPMLPWRNDAQKRDSEMDARLRALLAAQENERRERLAGPSIGVQVGPKEAEPTPEKPDPVPLLAGLCVMAGVVAGFAVYFGAKKN